MAGILDGIRVVDFGRYMLALRVIGRLRADVIRVERVDGGEDRFVTPVTDYGWRCFCGAPQTRDDSQSGQTRRLSTKVS